MRNRKGISIIYLLITMVTLTAFASLAVDYGRVQLAKTELRRAADSAAHHGASGLIVDSGEATQRAISFARRNTVDGQRLELERRDISFGKWDTKTNTFTRLTGSDVSKANSIRVVARRSTSRGTGLPLMFISLLGMRTFDIEAEAIVMVVPPIKVDQYVPATANPFLAGMPPGTKASNVNPHNSPDFAGTDRDPKQSPLAVKMAINEEQIYTFDSIDGTARHDPNLDFFSPDGELADIGHNNLTTNHNSSYGSKMYNQNGIADMKAPINALVGIFLDDKQPSLTSIPRNLDFTSETSRNFDTLRPQLKQIFFIGDGANSRGQRQEFVAPKGATRLYLATWDFYEWNNNYGFRNIKVERPMQIITVK